MECPVGSQRMDSREGEAGGHDAAILEGEGVGAGVAGGVHAQGGDEADVDGAALWGGRGGGEREGEGERVECSER